MTAAILPTDDLTELAARLGVGVERVHLLSPIQAVYLSGADFATLLIAEGLDVEAERQTIHHALAQRVEYPDQDRGELIMSST